MSRPRSTALHGDALDALIAEVDRADDAAPSSQLDQLEQEYMQERIIDSDAAVAAFPHQAADAAPYRPLTRGGARAAYEQGTSRFPRLTNMRQAMTPTAIGGPKKQSRLDAQRVVPDIKAHQRELRQDVGYAEAKDDADVFHAMHLGLSAASTLTGGAATPAGLASGLAAGVANVGRGMSEIDAADQLHARPRSPHGRAHAQGDLDRLAGQRHVLQGAAGMVPVPGAGAVAGRVHDRFVDDARGDAQERYVNGVGRAAHEERSALARAGALIAGI